MPLRFRMGSLAVLFAAFASPGWAQAPQTDLAKRGEYLATAGDCMGCHTTKGGEPFAGAKVETPFGIIYSPNITPDDETGIGKYTDDDFYKVMHQGLDHDGSYLYPAMPFDSYTKVTREDVTAIRAYLRNVKPVHQETPKNQLPFPYSVRASLAVWRAVNFHEGEFKPDPQRSDKVNRGAYLVEGLGHCGACHTPRNLLQGSKQSQALGGAEITGQGWFAPNISSDVRQGIGGWSEQELVDYLKTGVASGKAIVAGPMAEVVHGSLSRLTDDDVHAMAAYLKSVPAQSLFKNEQSDGSAAYKATGAVAYLNNCGYCHQENGSGIEGAIPNLAGNAVVRAGGADGVIRTILNGMEANGPYAPMPALGRAIAPGDIADIANYVRTAWGNAAPANATPGQVSELAKTTDTMLSGMSKCSPTPETITAALNRVGGDAMLQATNDGNALETLNALVPKLKQAEPSISQADLINGVTAAYCPIVMKDSAQPDDARLQQLQRFSMLAFTAIAQRKLPARGDKPVKTGQN